MPNGGLQNTILKAVLGKMASIFKKFSKNCGFLVQTRSKKSLLLVCHLCHKITDPIWNFLQIL